MLEGHYDLLEVLHRATTSMDQRQGSATAVALAIAHGAHVKAIQVRMGHSSAQVTLDRYGHLYTLAHRSPGAARRGAGRTLRDSRRAAHA